jgi:hypothetical protein
MISLWATSALASESESRWAVPILSPYGPEHPLHSLRNQLPKSHVRVHLELEALVGP